MAISSILRQISYSFNISELRFCKKKISKKRGGGGGGGGTGPLPPLDPPLSAAFVKGRHSANPFTDN